MQVERMENYLYSLLFYYRSTTGVINLQLENKLRKLLDQVLKCINL